MLATKVFMESPNTKLRFATESNVIIDHYFPIYRYFKA